MTFEALYIVFRVTPFSHNIARSLLKEPKIYFFDNALVKGDVGVQFENLMALCLLKHLFAKIDTLGESYHLHYLHTKEKQEVDFALVHDQTIEPMIEAKYADATPSQSLRYFHEKYHFPAYQVVQQLKHERLDGTIQVVEGLLFLQNLAL